MGNDRLRAKKPVTDEEKWSKGEVKRIEKSKVIVEDNGEIELNPTSAIIDLFRSRIEGKEKGAAAYYIRKKD